MKFSESREMRPRIKSRRLIANLARELHPDINPAKEAQERFKLVTHAYEVLSDSSTRASYDGGGNEGFGIGDIFDSFFGGGGQRGPQSRSQRGQDALLRVDLDLKEAVFGAIKVNKNFWTRLKSLARRWSVRSWSLG